MPISPEDWEAIMQKVEEHDATLPPLSPERQAVVDKNLETVREMEASGRRPATEEQIKIWQAWGDSELKRIDRERGETTE